MSASVPMKTESFPLSDKLRPKPAGIYGKRRGEELSRFEDETKRTQNELYRVWSAISEVGKIVRLQQQSIACLIEHTLVLQNHNGGNHESLHHSAVDLHNQFQDTDQDHSQGLNV